jgi:hypothetical protein
MRVRIDEAGQHYFAAAIDLLDGLTLRAQELVIRNLIGRTHSDNPVTVDENRSVNDDSEIGHLRTASRRAAGRSA